MSIPTLERSESNIAVLRLGNPDERVVTLTVERMRELRRLLEELKKNPPAGVILAGPHHEMFTAGADINLIRDVKDAAEAEALAREGQDTFAMLEALPCPTVAAISGPCVGGGCELVLACKVRLISDHKSSIIGLPEVKLGIIPGFGGTQRLPRLIGISKALGIILAGRTLRPKQALSHGLVHEVMSADELLPRAEQIITGQKPTRNIAVSFIDKLLGSTRLGRYFVRKKSLGKLTRETGGFYPAPFAALESVLLGLSQGLTAGYKYEARELGRLIVSPESRALVRVFLLSESSKGLGKAAKKAVEQVHAVVVGAGVMGAGIAGVLAKNDCQVVLKDTTDAALTRGMSQIQRFVGKMSYLSEQERSFILNRVEITTRDTAALGNTTIAIEAIFEELETKKKVLGSLAGHLPADAIIASNTSSLSITDIAAAIPQPDRVIGMHFFNPVEKMPLVEIVRGQKTGARAIAVVAALAVKLGKYPIVVEDVPGFLVNRILSPYIAEAAILLSEGHRISDIDEAAVSFGMPMGPLRLLDEVGLDVAAHVGEVMTKGYGDRMRAPAFASALVAKGRKGKKTGAGFYDFSADDATPSPEIRSLLDLHVPVVSKPDRQILADRLVYRLINEAVLCLDEGVAGTPGVEAAAQVDLGTVMGLGFPPFRGGVLHYAQSLGAEAVLHKLRALQTSFGPRFEPSPGIVQRAERKGTFLDKA